MSGRMTGDFFSLQGTKTHIWDKPGCYSNTEMTIKPSKSKRKETKTDETLTSTTTTSTAPTTARRHARKPLNTTLTNSYTPTTFQGTLNHTDVMGDSSLFRKSVTFDSNTFKNALKSSDYLSGSSSGLSLSREFNDSGVSSPNGTLLRSSDEDPWFTRSYHFSATDEANQSGSKDGPLGTYGVVLSTDPDTSNYYGMNDEDRSLAGLASNYYPVTLNASKIFKSIEAPFPANMPRSSAAKGLQRPNTAPWKPKRSKSPTRTKSPMQSKSPGRSKSPSMSRSRSVRPTTPTGLASQSIDKMFFMASEAPVTASASVYITSPFEQELARLKMEQLRLEEQHLLEVKRQEELERIRGPQPKWYELKTPKFHYEASKNNTLLKDKDNWQALMDYRTHLVSASNTFNKTYTS